MTIEEPYTYPFGIDPMAALGPDPSLLTRGYKKRTAFLIADTFTIGSIITMAALSMTIKNPFWKWATLVGTVATCYAGGQQWKQDIAEEHANETDNFTNRIEQETAGSHSQSPRQNSQELTEHGNAVPGRSR